MDTVTLTIDGRSVAVEKGKTVLQAAIENGIKVPYYCYHPGISVDGSCRVCLVKIEKMPKLQTACSTPVGEGMTRPAVRLILLIVFLAAIGATSYLFWMSERDAGTTRAAARTFDDNARAAIVATHDLRAAQQAYVASGQGADFWFERTTAIQTDLKRKIAALRSKATSSTSVSAFEDTLGVVQDFEQMDGRAREQVRARKLLPASDLVFADGLDLTQKIDAGIEKGRTAEIAAFDQEIAAINRRQGFSLVAGAAAGLLIVLLLLPVRDRDAESSGAIASTRLEDRPGM